MAVCQLMHLWLFHRHREQAPSHSLISIHQVTDIPLEKHALPRKARAHRPTATSSAQRFKKPCRVIYPQKGLLSTVHQFRRQGDDQEAAENQAAGEKP